MIFINFYGLWHYKNKNVSRTKHHKSIIGIVQLQIYTKKNTKELTNLTSSTTDVKCKRQMYRVFVIESFIIAPREYFGFNPF